MKDWPRKNFKVCWTNTEGEQERTFGNKGQASRLAKFLAHYPSVTDIRIEEL